MKQSQTGKKTKTKQKSKKETNKNKRKETSWKVYILKRHRNRSVRKIHTQAQTKEDIQKNTAQKLDFCIGLAPDSYV
eukprot:m.41392 g.41392  ORF g.41392 m.41392 type:complete len:77 (+) comp18797_c0_seq1:292-522(+)